MNEKQALAPPPDLPLSIGQIFRRGIKCYLGSLRFISTPFLLPCVFAIFWNLCYTVLWGHVAEIHNYSNRTLLPITLMLIANLALFFGFVWTTASRIYPLKRMALRPRLTYENAKCANDATQIEVFLALISINFLQFVLVYFWYCAWFLNFSLSGSSSEALVFIRATLLLVMATVSILGLQLFLTLSFNALVIGPEVGTQVLARGLSLTRSCFWRGCAFLLLLNALLLFVYVAPSPSLIYCLVTGTHFVGAKLLQLPAWVQVLSWIQYGFAFIVTVPLFAILNVYFFQDVSLRFQRR